jgi:hypothetical protein
MWCAAITGDEVYVAQKLRVSITTPNYNYDTIEII